MIKIKILKTEPYAQYKKGDILLVNWAFCNQNGGKEYYHDDRFSWAVPNQPFFSQDIPLENCKVLDWGGQKPKPKSKKVNIEQLAINFVEKQGYIYPSYKADFIERGFIAGYKAALKQIKK